MNETMRMRNIYKKSLAMQLIRLGHDLNHTMKNKFNPKFQVFVFPITPEFEEDFNMLTNKTEMYA